MGVAHLPSSHREIIHRIIHRRIHRVFHSSCGQTHKSPATCDQRSSGPCRHQEPPPAGTALLASQAGGPPVLSYRSQQAIQVKKPRCCSSLLVGATC